jgi:hypothetical protein
MSHTFLTNQTDKVIKNAQLGNIIRIEILTNFFKVLSVRYNLTIEFRVKIGITNQSAEI